MEELKKENDALKAKIAELEAKLNGSAASEKALSDEKAKVAATETQLAEVKKQNLQLVEEKSKLEKATKLAEQKSIFDKKLSEGAVVEAQREAFMAGDMAKFMELQQATKTTTIGHGGAGKSGSEDSAQEEILKLAEKKMADKSADTLQVAIRMVLSENAELKKKYEAGAQA